MGITVEAIVPGSLLYAENVRMNVCNIDPTSCNNTKYPILVLVYVSCLLTLIIKSMIIEIWLITRQNFCEDDIKEFWRSVNISFFVNFECNASKGNVTYFVNFCVLYLSVDFSMFFI